MLIIVIKNQKLKYWSLDNELICHNCNHCFELDDNFNNINKIRNKHNINVINKDFDNKDYDEQRKIFKKIAKKIAMEDNLITNCPHCNEKIIVELELF